MRYDNLRIETREVQVEFTVKMTEKELQQLVEVLGCTTNGDLVDNGCSVDSALAAWGQYSMFLGVLEEVKNAVQ